MSMPELDNFEGWARRLRRLVRDAVRDEKEASTLRPAVTVDGVLRIECYRYYRRLKRAGMVGRLAEHLAEEETGRWRRHKGKGADAVLRLLERSGKEWTLTPPRRGRIARELNFADRFNIHSKLLLAFLYEAGPHQLIRKAANARKAAPWMEPYQRLSNVLREDASKRKATMPLVIESRLAQRPDRTI